MKKASSNSFEPFHRAVGSHCDVENVASQRVAEKAGYTREGILRAWLEVDGDPRDHVLYSLLASEWRTQTFGS